MREDDRRMPHFQTISKELQGTQQGTVLRSRLHYIRSYALLRDGYLEHGAAVLFDSLLQALRWRSEIEGVMVGPGKCRSLWCEREMFEALADRLIVSTDFDMDALMDTIEAVIDGCTTDVDPLALFDRVESILEELGVLPLDESHPDFAGFQKQG
jgi:hypothetical protein